MKVVGFGGYSGAGKTTLLEQLIGRLKAVGKRVSVIKHAHHRFDIDHEGKDSWRHRRAGAYEVLIASDRRLAKIREYEAEHEPALEDLIAELEDDPERELWVLVEGFKHAALPKFEIWRAASGAPVLYATDQRVAAVVTDDAGALPQPTTLPVLDLNDPGAVVAYLLETADRYEYRPTNDTQPAAAAGDADAGRSAGEAFGGSAGAARD